MSTYEMGDSSLPAVPPANLPVYGFYLGGDTPHRWTTAEVRALKSRWALPIWVNTNQQADAKEVAADILSALRFLGWPTGTTVALDIEGTDQALMISALDTELDAAGYLLMVYSDKAVLPIVPTTSGGHWVADWTGTPHLYPDSAATQYASAKMTGLPWDSSLIDQAWPLHEINPPVVHRIPVVTMIAHLPELSHGDQGPAVRRLQHLLLAHSAGSLPVAGPDGIFGPETTTAVRSFQRIYGITNGDGIATADTWQRLVAG
jgi:phosphotransferase system HPr-like phosphotransfer protein